MDKDLHCHRELPKHSKEDKEQDHYGKKKVIWTDSKYIVNTAMTPERHIDLYRGIWWIKGKKIGFGRKIKQEREKDTGAD